MTDKMSSYKFDFKEVQNVARERHELVYNRLNSLKESLDLRIKELVDLVTKEVSKLEKLWNGIPKTVKVLLGAMTTLIEDVHL